MKPIDTVLIIATICLLWAFGLFFIQKGVAGHNRCMIVENAKINEVTIIEITQCYLDTRPYYYYH